MRKWINLIQKNYIYFAVLFASCSSHWWLQTFSFYARVFDFTRIFDFEDFYSRLFYVLVYFVENHNYIHRVQGLINVNI